MFLVVPSIELLLFLQGNSQVNDKEITGRKRRWSCLRVYEGQDVGINPSIEKGKLSDKLILPFRSGCTQGLVLCTFSDVGRSDVIKRNPGRGL